MDKPADTPLSLHPIIVKRWSPRSFEEKEIADDVIQRIFEAARWAPSSRNDQPWRFIIGKNKDKTWRMIFEILVDFNQKWAKRAPVLALAIGHKISAKTGQHNIVWQHDLGQSAAYITFQAMHEGLYVHQMGGLDTARAGEIFHVPQEYEVVTAIAMGYKDEPEKLEESFMKMEKSKRTRFAADNLFFTGEFGNPAFTAE
jgi:nitroreductase